MINQQLIDFIKKQSQGGLTREKISSDLLANGWNAQDIEEGFKAANVPIPTTAPIVEATPVLKTGSHLGGKIFLIVLIILLLGGGASAYYYKDTLLKLPVVQNILTKLYIPIPQTDVVATQTIEQPVVQPQADVVVPVATPVATETPQPNQVTDVNTTITPPPVVPKEVPPTPPVVIPAKTVQAKNLTDTQIEKILKNLRLEAEVYYWKSESYTGFCKSSDYTGLVKGANQTDLNCKDSKDAYAITSVISDGYWCVDNTGYDNKSSLNTGTVCVK